MKKRNVIIILILVITVFGLGVGAATMFSAKDIEYTPSDESWKVDNLSDAIDDLYVKASSSSKACSSSPFKLGDYVSMTPDSTSYTITTTDTGYTSSQTINPSELNIWRVININDDCTVDMVAEYVSSKDVYFKGKTGYQNSIGTLNKIAKQYEKDGYTVGSRHVGYSGQTEYITDFSALNRTSAPWTSQNAALLDEVRGGGDTLHAIDLGYITNAIGNFDTYRVGTSTLTNYWLASRHFGYANNNFWIFYIREGSEASLISLQSTYYYSDNNFRDNSPSRAVRPIVVLDSSVKASGGNGTKDNMYTLTK